MAFLKHISSNEIEEYPYFAFKDNIILVETLQGIEEIAQYLLEQSYLGYDTETQPSFTRGVHHQVSLLQLASADRVYLFRLDKIGLPDALIPVLQSPKILKIGAAIADDIKGMQKHHRFTPKGFIDLQKLAEHYGIDDKAVKKLAAIVLQVRISKSQQTSNWGHPIYTQEQMEYAATDAWVCREIYLRLVHSL